MDQIYLENCLENRSLMRKPDRIKTAPPSSSLQSRQRQYRKPSQNQECALRDRLLPKPKQQCACSPFPFSMPLGVAYNIVFDYHFRQCLPRFRIPFVIDVLTV